MSNDHQFLYNIEHLAIKKCVSVIQENFEQTSGIFPIILDHNGEAILEEKNKTLFQNLAYLSNCGMDDYKDIIYHLITINKKTHMPTRIKTSSDGFEVVAIPIIVDNHYIGSWLLSQLKTENFHKPISISSSISSKIDKLPELEFENIFNFLFSIGITLSNYFSNNKNKSFDWALLQTRFLNLMTKSKDYFSSNSIATCIVDYYSRDIIVCNKSFQTIFISKRNSNIQTNRSYEFDYNDICVLETKESLLDKNGKPGLPCSWEYYDNKKQIYFDLTSQAVEWIDGSLAIIISITDVSSKSSTNNNPNCSKNSENCSDISNISELKNTLINNKHYPVHLIFINIRDLREINNLYNRRVGDQLISNVISWIKSLSSNNISCYSVKRKSFAILLKNYNDDEAMEVVNKLYQRFDNPWHIDIDNQQQKIYSTADMGIIALKEPINSVHSLLNTYEKVIMFSKTKGELLLFEDQDEKNWRKEAELSMSLKSCVFNNMEGFFLNFQPFISIKTGKWVGLEVLCRWISPTLGFVPPDIFIRTAEEINLVSQMSYWIFETAISQVKKWGLDKNENFILSVNLSPIQLRDQKLDIKIMNLLKKYDYPPEKFALEITETLEVYFDDITIDLLDRIRDSGLKLFLDDFGVGYASFSHLKHIPINILKVDRSFITGIDKDLFTQHTVKIIVEYAKSIGLHVIIEGVETEQEVSKLATLDVDMIQGYFYCRPMNAEAMSGMLENFAK